MSLSEVFSYEAFVHAVSGTAGGSISMTLFYPLDVIRTHQQVGKESIMSLLKEEGISSMYKGLAPVIASLAASNFVYFYTNNLFKVLVRKFSGEKTVTVAQNLLVASLAGVVNVMTTCPMWVANTRLKLQSSKQNTLQESQNKQVPYTGLIDCMRRIYKEEGVQALWNGAGSSLMLVSNPTIHFVVYDKVKSIIDRRVKADGRKYLSSFEIFLTGAIAKALATIFTYPIQVAQSRQRANKDKSGSTFANTFKILADIFKIDGVLGWFVGMNAKLVQTILTAAFQFLCYEQIQRVIFSVMGKPQ
jgi:solute carrier family 25 (peroxisomal adenine nucleotide transporter), member 17